MYSPEKIWVHPTLMFVIDKPEFVANYPELLQYTRTDMYEALHKELELTRKELIEAHRR